MKAIWRRRVTKQAAITGAVLGQVARMAAVGIHSVDFPVAVAQRFERYLTAIGRPGRRRIRCRVLGQVRRTPVSIQDVDVIVDIRIGGTVIRHEGDLVAVG